MGLGLLMRRFYEYCGKRRRLWPLCEKVHSALLNYVRIVRLPPKETLCCIQMAYVHNCACIDCTIAWLLYYISRLHATFSARNFHLMVIMINELIIITLFLRLCFFVDQMAAFFCLACRSAKCWFVNIMRTCLTTSTKIKSRANIQS